MHGEEEEEEEEEKAAVFCLRGVEERGERGGHKNRIGLITEEEEGGKGKRNWL